MAKKSNEADRAKVRSMAAVGTSHALIAKRIGCTAKELDRLYGTELRRAGPETMAMVGANLFAAAKAGNTAAIIFWLKTRAGWKETIRREISGADGIPIVIDPLPTQIYLPCNGRGPCPKITDPDDRRDAYGRILKSKPR
jgi:hypothetical protein